MLAIGGITLRLASTPVTRTLLSGRPYSNAPSNTKSSRENAHDSEAKPAQVTPPKPKTQAELDKELLLKLQGLDGDGGGAGVEYEDGKPVSMKRSVKNNMFRYI